MLNSENVVIAVFSANMLQPGAIVVSDEVYAKAIGRVHRVKYEGDKFEDLPPPATARHGPTPIQIIEEMEERGMLELLGEANRIRFTLRFAAGQGDVHHVAAMLRSMLGMTRAGVEQFMDDAAARSGD